MFVNRKKELAFLQDAFGRKSAELLVLYGRRRMGKTALLQELVNQSPLQTLYHVAAQTTRAEELGRFSERLAEFFQDDVLRAQPFRSWEPALAYLVQQARRRPFGLLLDEFPYAVEGDSALPSLLQVAWDRDLCKTGIKMVLCGSSIGMMERICLSPHGPLFGRRTGQWKLDAFGPEEFALLWSGESLADSLPAYGVVGGCPLYASRMDPRRSIEANILDAILTKGAMLYDEVPFLLREELRDPHVYQSILSAVAGGATKFGELSGKTGLDRAHLTRYLSTLIGLGLLQREVPVTETHPEKSRKGLYRIRDPFMAFWYRFVFQCRDRLESGRAADVLNEVVVPNLDVHLSRVLEPAIGSLMRTRWRDRIPFEIAFAGRHWSDREEFDWLVLDAERRRAVAIEMKWTRRPVSGLKLLAELERKTLDCEALENCAVTHLVVSRSGFMDAPPSKAPGTFIDLREEKVGVSAGG